MKCWNCGQEIDRSDSAFCPNCGADLRSGASQTPQPQGDSRPPMPEASSDATRRYVTPTPSDSWDTVSSPGAEYDSLGTDFQTPETVVSDGVESSEQAKADYKRAKRELKDARKRAGKSNAPKIIAIILVILLAVAGGAFASYRYFAGDSSDSAASESEKDDTKKDEAAETDEASAETDSESSDAAASAQGDGDDAQALVGTWTGKLEASDGDGYCYGAQEMPLVITIESVDSANKITADIKVCFHAHEENENSVDSSPGDAYLELNDVTMTYSDGSFNYTVHPSEIDDSYDSDDSIELSFEYSNSGNANASLTGTARSSYLPSDTNFYSVQIDEFTFAKES
jgi:hypothetical protein